MDQNLWITVPAELVSAFRRVKFLKLNQMEFWVQISDYGVWKWFNWSLNKLLRLYNNSEMKYTKKPQHKPAALHINGENWSKRMGMGATCIKFIFFL